MALLLALPAAALAIPPVATDTSPAGTVVGLHDVTASGSLSYVMPVRTVPGTKGIEPTLGLAYDSLLGNGWLGQGVALKGLANIQRCPAQITQDGAHRAVRLDSGDRFCFEGQRLFAVSGAYGADGTVYGTELEQFDKVVSYGSAGAGPAYFRVWTKGGQVLEFGNTADSRIEAQGSSTVRLWALNRIEDRRGNYLTVGYQEDNANGAYVPVRIDYTGNANASPALAPYASVTFTWASRTDIESDFVAGSRVTIPQRLDKISTFFGAALVKEYRLGYQTSAWSKRSLLASVSECDGAGACLPATSIAWHQAATGFEASAITAATGSGRQWLDLAGLGRAQACTIVADSGSPTGKTVRCHDPGAAGGNVVASYPLPSHFEAGASFVDFNGDGRLDVCRTTGTNGSNAFVRCSLFDGSAFTGDIQSGVTDIGEYWFYNNQATVIQPVAKWFVDVNGDNRTDFCRITSTAPSPDRMWCTLSAGTAFGATIDLGGVNRKADGNGSWMDMEADRQLWYCKTASTPVKCYKFTTSGFGPELVARSDTGVQVGGLWGDVNGDGRQDACSPVTTTSLQCHLGTGAGFTTGPLVSGIDTGFNRTLVDVNGDGYADFCRHIGNGDLNMATRQRCLLGGPNGFGGEFLSPILTAGATRSSAFVDVTGDGRADYCTYDGTQVSCWPSARGASDVVQRITNGLGAWVEATYSPMAEGIVHGKAGPAAIHPVVDRPTSQPLVKTLDVSNGVGSSVRFSYTYKGYRYHVEGFGSLGFSSREETNEASGLKRSFTYRQEHPFIGFESSVAHRTGGGTLLYERTAVPAAVALGGTRNAVYEQQATQRKWDTNGAFMDWRRRETTAVDTYLQPTEQVLTTFNADGSPDGHKQVVRMAFRNDVPSWLLGMATSIATERFIPDGTSRTRTVSADYDATGFLSQLVMEPNGAANVRSVDTYVPDAFGNRAQATTSGADIVSRTVATGYDTTGRFAITRTLPHGLVSAATYDGRFGVRTSEKDPNNVTTSWTLDGFGRITSEVRADGATLKNSERRCSNCWKSSAYYVEQRLEQTSNAALVAPLERKYFDTLGRETLVMKQGFAGEWVLKETEYDARGRLSRQSRPYFDGQSALWELHSYAGPLGDDPMDRVQSILRPDGGETHFSFDGRMTRVHVSTTPGVWSSKATIFNSQDVPVRVIDAQNSPQESVTNYAYEHFKNLESITDHRGNVIKATFDIRGRRTELNDPNLGRWTYSFNSLGEQVSSTDAKLQSFGFQYDLLSRLTQQSAPDALNRWSYDSCANGKGKLCSIDSPAGSGGNGYARAFGYDAFGRLVSVTTTVDGSHTVNMSYDAAGRTSVLTYPTGFATRRVYNAYGYFSELRNHATGGLLWAAGSLDSDGDVSAETLGNGLPVYRQPDAMGRTAMVGVGAGNSLLDFRQTYGLAGQPTSRTESFSQLSETFAYDPMQRLVQSAVSGATTQALLFDPIGNLTSKTGVGTLAYPASGAGSVRPGAAASATGLVNAVAAPSFLYDANGNMTSGAGRGYGWMSFNQPSYLTGNGYRLDFLYDAAYQRVKKVVTAGGVEQYRTIYLNEGPELLYERETRAGVVEHRHYFSGAAGLTGVHVTTSAGAQDTRYLHADMQGSIVGVSNASGMVERLGYDAWGRRRNPSGTEAAAAITPSKTSRGYTGHEHLDEVGLIHMNGRLYDPELSRFVSADPLLAQPYYSQSTNRYLYVLGAATMLVDPDGFEALPSKTKDGVPSISSTTALNRVEIRELGEGATADTLRFRSKFVGRGNSYHFRYRETVIVGAAVQRQLLLASLTSAELAALRMTGKVVLQAGARMIPGVGQVILAVQVTLWLYDMVQSVADQPATSSSGSLSQQGNGGTASAGSTTSGGANGEKPSLLDPQGEQHILDGDGPNAGGGHRHGTGKSGKSEFPANWSDDKIKGEVSDVATDPGSVRTTQPNGRIKVQGTRDGVDITVIVEPNNRGGRIVTAFPTNTPRNP